MVVEMNILLSRITNLAISADRPLIIIGNPNKSNSSRFGHYNLIANIGEAYAGFESYSLLDLVELYSDLKAQLESQNAQNNKQGNDNTANAGSNQT
jgi:hypothetical protein